MISLTLVVATGVTVIIEVFCSLGLKTAQRR
jgi:hypothetical protein